MASTESRLPPKTPRQLSNPAIPSSSPAFATPANPIRPNFNPPRALQTNINRESIATPPPRSPSLPPPSPASIARAPPILPILLPPATLRPIAFRTFTKKHNLTLTSSALQLLATFVGRHCGSGWREEGLAELVLEEVAKLWKKEDGRVIVDANNSAGGNSAERLKEILKQVEGSMINGRIMGGGRPGLSRQTSYVGGPLDAQRPGVERNESQDSFGMSGLDVEQEEEDENDQVKDPRAWLKVVGAFEQPRMVFNPGRKQFERSNSTASMFPPPSQKIELFRQRYHIIHQRLLRNESFQTPAVGRSVAMQQAWKVTPIANLLGRGGTGHLLLGMLAIAPTGSLALSDLTGSIALDIGQATPIDEVETWLCPGMIVLVDGVYEEEHNPSKGSLEGVGGVGGTIGGRFIGLSIGAPRAENRSTSLSLSDASANGDSNTIGGGFGWVDFLGVGSERAVGSRMRRLERRLLTTHHLSLSDDSVDRQLQLQGQNKVLMLGECSLDNPRTLLALRKIFTYYSSSANSEQTRNQEVAYPLAIVLFGSFISNAALSSPSTATSTSDSATDTSSIAYKETFDALASVLSEYPSLLRSSTFIFVPGDNDPWASSFSAGAAVPLPRDGIPQMFTSRIKRVFASANAETPNCVKHRTPGAPVFTTNPSRVSLFGPSHEIAIFRDDISGRLRRNAIALPRQQQGDEENAHETAAQVNGESDADGDIAMSGALLSPSAEPSQEPEIQTQFQTHGSNNESHTQDAQKKPAMDARTLHARRLTKTLLDQSHLSPFPLSIRPQHWSYASSALSLYPLPTAVALCDSEAEAWGLVYQGCWVGNVGKLVVEGKGGTNAMSADRVVSLDGPRARGNRGAAGIAKANAVGAERSAKGLAKWIEYDVVTKRGKIREMVLNS